MDKKKVERYPLICAAIAIKKSELNKTVSDVVSGSALEDPYNRTHFKIEGVANKEAIIKRLAELTKQKNEIEDWIKTLPLKQRMIVDLRVRKGLTWNSVAAKMGYAYTEAAVAKIYERIFKQ